MAAPKPYETAAGTRWHVRYRKPDHSEGHKRGFLTKKAAALYLAGVEVSKGTGAYVDPLKAKVTLAVWLDLWLAGRADLQPTSRERVRSIIEKHIKPPLGHYSLGSLDGEIIQAWAAKLTTEGGQGAWSVRKIVNVLSGCLETAVPKRIATNPARKLKLPKVTKTAKRYLTHAEVIELAAAVDGLGKGAFRGDALGYGLAVKVMAYCGPRWGELSGLTVGDVDFVRGRLELRRAIVEVNGVQIVSGLKDYEERSVPVPVSLLADLRQHIEGKAADSPLFAAARGGWLRGRVFRRGWLDQAAIQIGEDGLTPHELRHTAASLAISAGANVKAVQKMLGHASAAVTLDVYADLFDEDLDSVSVALDEKIAETIAAKSRPKEAEGAATQHSADASIPVIPRESSDESEAAVA